MISILFESTTIRALVSIEISLLSLALMVRTFESDPVFPLPSFPLQHSIIELSIKALLFCNDSTCPMWQVILEESEIIKTTRIILAITISLSVL